MTNQGNIKCELGECIYVLYHKLWSKYQYKGQLKSRGWWERRRDDFINSPTVIIDPKDNLVGGYFDKDGNPIPDPIPFEKEMGWADETSEHWLEWMQKAFRKIYER